MIGKLVSHYRVLRRIGGGGMGVVYEAEDVRLGRTVALKFLPERLARDPQALERFQREARAASALDHPGICTVHDFDDDERERFIVMERLEGRSLRDLLQGQPLPLETVLDVGVQLADALDAAHAKGILHRDVKPANVFVTGRGQAKLLDFGLARMAGDARFAAGAPADSALATECPPDDGLTSPGTVVGTAAYMSPEQARGLPLDARTDVFSLGALLYEMATGRRPFEGATPAVLFDAILNREPTPPTQLNPSVPADLERIVGKALEKDREVRYQSAREVEADLKRLRRDASSGKAAAPGAGTAPAPAAGSRRRPRALALGLAGLVAIAAAGLWLARPARSLRVVRMTPLTSDGVPKYTPVADRTRVYFVRRPGPDRARLAQVSAAGGEAAPLEAQVPQEGNLVIAGPSPDGSELLVLGFAPFAANASLWRVPVPAGSPRRLGALEVTGAAWFPDGRSIVYTQGRDVGVATGDGAGARRIWTAGGSTQWPSVSPDGRHVRVFVSEEQGVRLWQVGVDGSRPRALPHVPGALGVYQGRWLPDGRAFVLMAWDGRDQDLWALLEPSGLSRAPAEPVRLTSGPLIFKDPFPSPDGRRVFALGEQPRTELVRFDPGSRRFVPHLGGISVRMLDYSPDGQWVAAVSVPGSALWRSRPDGTQRRQLSVPGRAAFLPRWSPDGRRIAFLGWERGRPFKVQVVPAEGGETESLFPGDRDEADPDWSPDGRTLVSGFWPDDNPSRGHEIRQVDLETRMVSVVPGSRGLFSPRFSPDGRSLAALSVSNRALGLLDLATGRWRTLPAGESLAFPEWTRDGRFVDVNRGSQRIRVRLADGQVEERASFEGLRVMSDGLGNWVGRTPDGSLLGVRDATLQEIYALEIEGP